MCLENRVTYVSGEHLTNRPTSLAAAKRNRRRLQRVCNGGGWPRLRRTPSRPCNLRRRQLRPHVVSVIGGFTRGDRPLRWPARCECCAADILPPCFFQTPPVSERGRTRYRCLGCRHAPMDAAPASAA